MTKTNEEGAIRDAYEQQIRLMYVVLLDALVQGTDPETACQRLRKGIALARKAMDLACQIVSEKGN